jgi:gamma-glutamylcyclotransferase (GGCT)/AIG2-like uncharacterized protein YtfP
VGEYLFVYGTLRSEFSNEHAKKLRTNARLVGPATVRGSIFRVSHYPGYRPEPDGEVTGELYLLKDAGGTLAELDRYEGSDYKRLEITVSTGDSAWIYEYAGEVPLSVRIDSGDFVNP